MSDASKKKYAGFVGLLTLIFIGLKLTGLITWPWGLVLLPLYAVPMLIIASILVIAVLVAIVAVIDDD